MFMAGNLKNHLEKIPDRRSREFGAKKDPVVSNWIVEFSCIVIVSTNKHDFLHSLVHSHCATRMIVLWKTSFKNSSSFGVMNQTDFWSTQKGAMANILIHSNASSINQIKFQVVKSLETSWKQFIMSSIVFFSCSIFIDNLISGFDGPSYKLSSTSEKERPKNPCLRSSKEHSILNHITATTIWSELWLTEFCWSLSFRSVPWPKIVFVFTTKNVVRFEQHEIHWSGTVFISGTLTRTSIKTFWKIKVQISRYWFN